MTAGRFRTWSCVVASSLLVGWAFGIIGVPSGSAGASPTWSVVSSPSSSTTQENYLEGVACTSASSCTTVGYYNNGTVEQTLIEQWNGTAWTIVTSPDTSTSENNELYGVACTSASSCTAVGFYETGTNDQTLIEQWNGITWTIATSPNTSTSENNELRGVSCTSASACTAAGEYNDGTVNQTLIEQWNGTTWSIVTSPDPNSSWDNDLEGISCTSATVCTAVGDYFTGSYEQTLIERWNGTTWSIASGADTSTTQSNYLSGVSCTSATVCTAVGDYYSGAYEQTLIEQWNGSAWSVVTSPNVTGSLNDFLAAVSCTSSAFCTAVGNYDTLPYQILIEQWNGSTWTIATATGGTDSQFEGVSCTSATACAAAGNYFSGTDFQTLIEMLPGLPVVSGVSPSTGPTTGGTTVTISGSNFLGASAVDFGTLPSPSVTVTSDTTLSAAVPPRGVGVVDVTVKSQRGTSTTSIADQFTYRTPGYDLAGSDGGVFVFPTGQSGGFYGSLPGLGVTVNDIVGIVPTNSFNGYDLVGNDGGVFVFPIHQSTGFYGSLPGLGVHVNDIVGIVPTDNDQGYDLVGDDGGVFVFPTGQSAGFYGSLPGLGVHVNDIVGIVATPGGGGYFLVGRDGGVFTFGNAPFFGSLPSLRVAVDDITGIASTPDGKGYYLVGADGSVFAFGDATSHGSLPGLGVSVSDIVSIVPTPDGKGYWLIGSDGGVFAFGDATSRGSLPGLKVSVNDIVGAVPTA
jgi:hypothetical protein